MLRTRRAGILLALLSVAVVVLPACRKKDSLLDDVPSEPAGVLFDRAERLLADRKLNAAVRTLKQLDLQSTSEERERLGPLVQLRIADATYYQGDSTNLIEARQAYLLFVARFRDHPLGPYALFQSGMCSLKQAGHPSKDQTDTLQAISDFAKVRREYPRSPYALAALGKLREAESILAEHEYIVGRFYMRRKDWKAAAKRLQEMTINHPDYIDSDKIYYQLSSALVKLDRTVEAEIYLERLLRDYPDSSYAAEAQKLIDQYDLKPRLANGATAR